MINLIISHQAVFLSWGMPGPRAFSTKLSPYRIYIGGKSTYHSGKVINCRKDRVLRLWYVLKIGGM